MNTQMIKHFVQSNGIAWPGGTAYIGDWIIGRGAELTVSEG